MEREFDGVEDRELINMLWEKCIPNELYAFITLLENFMSLSDIDNTFQNSNVMVRNFIENGTNFKKMVQIFREYLKKILDNMSVYLFFIFSKILYTKY